jgi:hypothetical protein
VGGGIKVASKLTRGKCKKWKINNFEKNEKKIFSRNFVNLRESFKN